MILSVENNLDSLAQTLYTFTSVNVNSGGTVWPVKNINSLTNQYAQQVGKTGEEQSEIVIISGAPSGTAFNSSGTARFNHPQDTPIFQIHYDSIIFKRSTAGTAGTATSLATVAITPDSLFTEYNDTSGVATYAYKTQYYNTLSGDLSSESDWFIPGGPTFYSLQSIRDRVRKSLYNASFITDDTIINSWINEWVELMTNSAIKVDQGYSIGTANVAFGTAGMGTITDATFKQVNKVEITYDGVSYLLSQEIPLNRFSTGDLFSSVYPAHYWQGDSVIGVLPQGQAGTAKLTYSQRNTPLVNDIDELPFSLRAYTTSCIEYVQYRAYDNDQKPDYADRHYQRYIAEKANFISEITPRDQSGPQTIDILDSLSGMNEDIGVGSDWIY